MEPMKIDASTNLVFPITDKINGYHVPISHEVFELNYRILSATKAAIESKGVHYQMGSGPQVATLTLLDEATKDAIERGDVDENEIPDISDAHALLGEIKRLTTVMVPGNEGYNIIPVNLAVTEGEFDKEDWSEALSALVFFTCHYYMVKKRNRISLATATALLLGGSITSLSAMAFTESLPTSTIKDDTDPESSETS